MRECGVQLTGVEMKKYRYCQNVIEGKMTQKEAAQSIELSTRQVRRLIEKLKLKGANGLIHGLAGKQSNNKLKIEAKSSIINLWKEKYSPAGFNFSHFTEKLNEIEGIKVSKDTVRRLLRSESLTAKPIQKRKKYHKQRERRKTFGELLQLDTSPHDWLSTGKKYHLIDIVDDATSRVLFARLFESDGTLPNMLAMEEICRKFGLPMSFYTDRATWFSYNFKNPNGLARAKGNSYETQIQKALKKLGVDLILAYSPEAKGRVERNHRTYQDRLIAELKLNNIKHLTAANEYLDKIFIPDSNNRFAKQPASSESSFVQIANLDCLKDIFCMKFETKVRNDNTVSKKDLYSLQLLSTAKRVSWAQAPIEVRLHTDYTWSILHRNTGEKIPFKILYQNIPIELKYGKPLIEFLKAS